MPKSTRSLALLAAALLLPACDDTSGPPYDPVLPTSWSPSVTNSFFPLVPGTRWEFRAVTGEGTETTTVEVLAQTRMVNGVAATVVRDRVFLDGELIEDTFDWFAQDSAGNVWYLGEDTKEMENGRVVSTEGSWEWGRRGALPGIVMWADPVAHSGEAYRQEFFEGEAEDWGRVVAAGQSVTVPLGSFTGCIQTEDWSGLESGREFKYYCPQVGVVLETPTSRPSQRNELMALLRPAGR